MTARMDLEAAYSEARSARADSKRELVITRNRVADACAQQDAIKAQGDTAMEEVKLPQEQIHVAHAQLRSLHEDTAKREKSSSWWSLPDWLFLNNVFHRISHGAQGSDEVLSGDNFVGEA